MAKIIKKSTVKKSAVPKAQKGKKITTAGQAYMKYVPGATAKDTLGTDDTRFRGPGFAEKTNHWDAKNKMLDMTYGENNPADLGERAKQSPAAVKAYVKELKRSKAFKTGGTVKKKMKNGGSLSGLKASTKRDKGTDVGGAFTKVQKKTLAGAKGKASLTKDKQLGATKMAKKGMSVKKK
jgi:hypothetical protein